MILLRCTRQVVRDIAQFAKRCRKQSGTPHISVTLLSLYTGIRKSVFVYLRKGKGMDRSVVSHKVLFLWYLEVSHR